MDKDYSNRELDSMFEQITEKLDLIHEQTIKTNGRVSSLENYKWAMVGALGVISSLIIPLFLDILKK